MKKSKMILIVFLIILIIVPVSAFFIADANRDAGKYVKLEATQTVSTSGSVYGRWKYITEDTFNDESSVQDMYAVMQYRYKGTSSSTQIAAVCFTVPYPRKARGIRISRQSARGTAVFTFTWRTMKTSAVLSTFAVWGISPTAKYGRTKSAILWNRTSIP